MQQNPWKRCLKNHGQDLVSLDGFTGATLTHKLLVVWLILAHDRRRVVHVHVTQHPTAPWTAQQVVNAFQWDDAPRYWLRDRDQIDGTHVRQCVRHLEIAEVIIAPNSP